MSARQIEHFPINDNGNGWSRILPPRTPKPALSGPKQVDWVVESIKHFHASADVGAAR